MFQFKFFRIVNYPFTICSLVDIIRSINTPNFSISNIKLYKFTINLFPISIHTSFCINIIRRVNPPYFVIIMSYVFQFTSNFCPTNSFSSRIYVIRSIYPNRSTTSDINIYKISTNLLPGGINICFFVDSITRVSSPYLPCLINRNIF